MTSAHSFKAYLRLCKSASAVTFFLSGYPCNEKSILSKIYFRMMYLEGHQALSRMLHLICLQQP